MCQPSGTHLPGGSRETRKNKHLLKKKNVYKAEVRGLECATTLGWHVFTGLHLEGKLNNLNTQVEKKVLERLKLAEYKK